MKITLSRKVAAQLERRAQADRDERLTSSLLHDMQRTIKIRDRAQALGWMIRSESTVLLFGHYLLATDPVDGAARAAAALEGYVARTEADRLAGLAGIS